MLFKVIPTGKIEVVELQVNPELSGCGVHHAQALGHHFLANAIAGDHSNAVLAHTKYFLKSKVKPEKLKA
jgi:hypothetical protein